MLVSERPLAFDCRGERLIGVAALPEQSATAGVVMVVGGPQYRVGSHRQFVLLSRSLAAHGIAALRFDYRGMGDSTGTPPGFESTAPDIEAAIAALQAVCPSATRIVLWGLCDAAAGALLYQHATRDPRVAGMVLINPWVRSDDTLASTYVRHYYGRRLLERAFWRKLVSGKVDLGQSARSIAAGVAALVRSVGGRSQGPPSTFQDRMADALRGFGRPVLILLSERDLTAQEFSDLAGSDLRWAGLAPGPAVERMSVAQADHTFSTAAWRRDVEEKVVDWLRRHEFLPPRTR